MSIIETAQVERTKQADPLFHTGYSFAFCSLSSYFRCSFLGNNFVPYFMIEFFLKILKINYDNYEIQNILLINHWLKKRILEQKDNRWINFHIELNSMKKMKSLKSTASRWESHSKTFESMIIELNRYYRCLKSMNEIKNRIIIKIPSNDAHEFLPITFWSKIQNEMIFLCSRYYFFPL